MWDQDFLAIVLIVKRVVKIPFFDYVFKITEFFNNSQYFSLNIKILNEIVAKRNFSVMLSTHFRLFNILPIINLCKSKCTQC